VVRPLGDGRAIFEPAASVADAPFLGGGGASYSDPEFSPDGTRLLFRSNRSGAWEVWIADADGGNATALTGDPANDGAAQHEYQGEGPAHFSPDGQAIVWTRKYPDTEYDVWIMRADGSDKRNLTADHANEDTYPFFSPDGQWIAFSSNRDGNDEIYAMHPDGTDVRRVTENDGPDLAPVWVAVE
jgi:Tol biopolymer transport system component